MGIGNVLTDLRISIMASLMCGGFTKQCQVGENCTHIDYCMGTLFTETVA